VQTAAVQAGSIRIDGVASVNTGALTASDINVRATNGTVGTGDIAGGTVLVQASGNTTVANVTTANGAVTLNAGSIDGTASANGGNLVAGNLDTGTGNITLLAANGTLRTGTISAGTVQLTTTGTARDISLDKVIRAAALSVTASGKITATDSASVTGDITLTAGTAVDIKDADSSGNGTIRVTATNGLLKTGVLSGGAITLKSTAGGADIGGVSRSSGLGVEAAQTVTASGNIRVAGTASVTAARLDLVPTAALNTDGRILLRAAPGAGDISIANGATSLFDNEDMPRVTAPTVQIDGGVRNIVIGATTLFPNVLRVGVSTTGNINVVGALKFESNAPPAGDPGNTANARTLTLGGDATAGDTSAITDQVNGAANVMANRVIVETQTGLTAGSMTSGGQLIATNSVVRVRGTYVALGLKDGGRFLDTLLPATPLTATEVRTKFTELPSSTFYQSIPNYTQTSTRPPIVTANRLVVGVGQWGVIQNTGSSAQPGGGVSLNSVQLVNLGGAGAPQGGPIVGFFGMLGGQDGVAAALRITVSQLGGVSPNNVRINGCVALTTAGCIVTGLPLPLVQLNDPGRGLLIRSAPDLILPLELISGTTNEALWRDDQDLVPSVPAAPTTAPPPNAPRPGDGLP
jgi:hypothetical protein